MRANYCRARWFSGALHGAGFPGFAKSRPRNRFFSGVSSRSAAVFRPLAWQPIRRWWDGVIVAAVTAAIAFGGGNLGAAAQERPQPPIVCGGEIVARGSAGRIADGRTFVLDDGREVRLAGIEVPPLAADSGSAPGGAASKDDLPRSLPVPRSYSGRPSRNRPTATAESWLTPSSPAAAASASSRRNYWPQALPESRRGWAAGPAPWNS